MCWFANVLLYVRMVIDTLAILTHCYIIKNVKILELNKNKFNTPLFFGRTFVLLKTHLP